MSSNPVIQALMGRKSVRKYTKEVPSDEVVETIVRAGQQAPFASQLVSVIRPTTGKFAFGAPLHFIICVDAHRLGLFMERRGWKVATNDLSILLLGIQDASYLAENMVIAAEGLGLGSCFLGEVSMNPERVRRIARDHSLPPRVLPLVELVMGYPDEEKPVRPRFPLGFTLFKDRYPDLSGQALTEAMEVMDSGYIKEGYYRNAKVKLPLEDGRPDSFTFDDYGWTEHISRKWGQWAQSPDGMLEVLKERGFDLGFRD